jgi:hypothetical protein
MENVLYLILMLVDMAEDENEKVELFVVVVVMNC